VSPDPELTDRPGRESGRRRRRKPSRQHAAGAAGEEIVQGDGGNQCGHGGGAGIEIERLHGVVQSRNPLDSAYQRAERVRQHESNCQANERLQMRTQTVPPHRPRKGEQGRQPEVQVHPAGLKCRAMPGVEIEPIRQQVTEKQLPAVRAWPVLGFQRHPRSRFHGRQQLRHEQQHRRGQRDAHTHGRPPVDAACKRISNHHHAVNNPSSRIAGRGRHSGCGGDLPERTPIPPANGFIDAP
jgi:hypothetical protein